MSTISRISELEKLGKLLRFCPNMKIYEGEVRKISILPSLNDWLFDNDNVKYKALVRAHLKEFVIGARVDDTKFMKQLEPFSKRVWEISPRFNPQHRIFGVFAEKDWFIATHQQERKKCDTQEKWEREINHTLRNWGRLFGSTKPLSGADFSNFVYNGVRNDKRKK